jgi:hypothetical protein
MNKKDSLSPGLTHKLYISKQIAHKTISCIFNLECINYSLVMIITSYYFSPFPAKNHKLSEVLNGYILPPQGFAKIC